MRGPQSSSDAACARQRREAMRPNRCARKLGPFPTQVLGCCSIRSRVTISILRSEIDIVATSVIIIVFRRYLSGCSLIPKLLYTRKCRLEVLKLKLDFLWYQISGGVYKDAQLLFGSN